jgi:glutamate/tyrosine decarboxylase-like PLP-dependent enzyme
MDWPAMPYHAIRARVFDALSRNMSYRRQVVLGLPGSVLDREVFPPLPELERFALLQTFMDNPNHIGCHTLGASEGAFSGTHQLERELLALCAEQILGAAPGSTDGYVASGGTESNIQALWTYRNLFRHQGAGRDDIGVLCSEDTHYSAAKAANLLDVGLWTVPVHPERRTLSRDDVERVARRAQAAGVRYLAVVLNMGTTMFGTVDDPDEVLPVLDGLGLSWRAHVDAAFGGFIYPFTAPHNPLDLRDPRISSVTLDGHKMLQAPYGTGIHLIRKGLIQHVRTDNAQYVPGLDSTLVGSRSGTNAVAMWMILMRYGAEGGAAFCADLVARTTRLCAKLDDRGVRYVREPHMNVVAMRADDVPQTLQERYLLVPDTHEGPANWRKIVVMDHVTDAMLDAFLADLDSAVA